MAKFRVRLARTSKFVGTIEVDAPDRDAAEKRVDEVVSMATHQRLSGYPATQMVWVTPLWFEQIQWDEEPDDECGTNWAGGLEEVTE